MCKARLLIYRWGGGQGLVARGIPPQLLLNLKLGKQSSCGQYVQKSVLIWVPEALPAKLSPAGEDSVGGGVLKPDSIFPHPQCFTRKMFLQWLSLSVTQGIFRTVLNMSWYGTGIFFIYEPCADQDSMSEWAIRGIRNPMAQHSWQFDVFSMTLIPPIQNEDAKKFLT